MKRVQFTKAGILDGKIRTEQCTLDDLNSCIGKAKKMKSNGEPSAKIDFYDNEVYFEIDETINFLEEMASFYIDKISALEKEFEKL